MDNLIRVLVTGAGSPGGPGIIKALQAKGVYVVGADINNFASGRFLCDEFESIPKPDDPSFMDEVIKVCKNYDVEYIFPLVTKELYRFSMDIDKYHSHNIQVLVSGYESLKILNDKKILSNFCNKLNVPTPNFKVFNKSSELISHLESISEPVVVKPSYGNGSRGIRILDDGHDKFYSMFNDKPNSLRTTKSEYIDIIKGHDIPEIMVCEYLPGDEVTVDCIVGKSHESVILIRKRTEMREGISVAGEFILDEIIEQNVKSILSNLPCVFGPIGFQFKKSFDGIYKILESNPRLQGTSVSAFALGYNYPYNCLSLLHSNCLTEPPVKSGFAFKRFYNEVYYKC